MNKGTGWERQQHDRRDKIYVAPDGLLKKPEVNLRCSQYIQKEPYDQERLNSCTANAIAAALRFGKNAEHWVSVEVNFDPSRLHIYFNERLLKATDHEVVSVDQLKSFLNAKTDTVVTESGKEIPRFSLEASLKADTGAQLRDGVKSLHRYGVCLETTWPYMPPSDETGYEKFLASRNYYAPPAGCLEEGIQNIDSSLTYWRIRDNEDTDDPPPALIDHMEAALTEGFPVAFGIRIPNHNPIRPRGTKAQQGLNEDFVYTGRLEDGGSFFGHALLAVGYNREQQQFVVLNSWGSAFGDNGYFYLPYWWFAADTGTFQGLRGHSYTPTNDFWVIKSPRRSDQ